jgi:hypothetical protein
MNARTHTDTLLLDWVFLYVQNLKKPYIHEHSRESYRAWWELQTKDVWYSNFSFASPRHESSPQEIVRRLYPHLFPEKRAKRRYSYDRSKYQDHRPMVSHTTVFPDGTKETYEWKSTHGKETRRYWGRNWSRAVDRDEDTFRVGHAKGVKKEKGRKADSLNRAEKTRDFRQNDKVTSAWPMSCGAKRSAQIEDNRHSRRTTRALLKQGRYDEVQTQMDPTDTWKWD